MESTRMFNVGDFAHLRFLEGRWEGTGPDGKPFYEQYSFPNDSEMRSSRYAGPDFGTVQDGSVVALAEGRVTSTWKEFEWEASELTVGKACFAPVNAPSAFSWERLSGSAVQVTQRWIDSDGQAQQYIIPLRRLQHDDGASTDAPLPGGRDRAAPGEA
jgi:hypothetical protein